MKEYEYTLCEVLARRFAGFTGAEVQIPPYQRPYRWAVGDVRKLLDDLDDFRFKTVEKQEEPSDQDGCYDEGAAYYYGTICFYANRDGDKVALELIDGQQRLTSFLILFQALLCAVDGFDAVQKERRALIDVLKEAADPAEWQGDDWRPRFVYRQPQTQEHIRSIYRELLADYLRVKALANDAKAEVGEDAVRAYAANFFRRELRRLKYALTNGVFAVRIIESRYDADLFFQCENNRGMDMDVLDILKAYHMRIALAASDENSAGEPAPGQESAGGKIREIWKTLTATEERSTRLRKTVVGLLLLRVGEPYWMFWDKRNVEKLKGMHGTVHGNRVVDAKLALSAQMPEGGFLPDLMSPVIAGMPFFETLAYYQRMVEALCLQKSSGGEVDSVFARLVLNPDWQFDDSRALAIQAAVCWLDRFSVESPDLSKPFDEDVKRLCCAYNRDFELLLYIQYYIRLFKRLRKPITPRDSPNTITVFAKLVGARQTAFFKLDRSFENLLTLPYRTNSPADCRRELERLTHPDQVGWPMAGDHAGAYRKYVAAENEADIEKLKDQGKQNEHAV